MTANTRLVTDEERADGIAGSQVLEIDLASEDVDGREYVRILINGVAKGSIRIA